MGNHEKKNNEEREALRNTAAFSGYLDPEFGPDRMYYRKDIGPAAFIFMDTNDIVYGDHGEGGGGRIPIGSRAQSQMEWLEGELNSCVGNGVETVVVVMHHPVVQSSKKHRAQSVSLWNLEYNGETLGQIFMQAGMRAAPPFMAWAARAQMMSQATPPEEAEGGEPTDDEGEEEPAAPDEPNADTTEGERGRSRTP